MTTRTDIHSESLLNPEDYREEGYFDANPPEGATMFAWETAEYDRLIRLLESNSSSVHEPTGSCAHCGSRIRHHVVLKHLPTETYIAVGMTCAWNRFSQDLPGWNDYKRRMEQHRKEAVHHDKVQEWAALDPRNQEVVEFFQSEEYEEEQERRHNGFLSDILHKLNRWGSLSEKQAAAVLKCRDRAREWKQKREAEAEKRNPAPSGRGVTITGEVVGAKVTETHFTYYGEISVKLTIRDDRGFMAWGSAPSSWYDEAGEKVIDCPGEFEEEFGFKGHRVRLVANLSPSDDDPTFAFYKRPRKATFLDLTQGEYDAKLEQIEADRKEAWMA